MGTPRCPNEGDSRLLAGQAGKSVGTGSRGLDQEDGLAKGNGYWIGKIMSNRRMEETRRRSGQRRSGQTSRSTSRERDGIGLVEHQGGNATAAVVSQDGNVHAGTATGLTGFHGVSCPGGRDFVTGRNGNPARAAHAVRCRLKRDVPVVSEAQDPFSGAAGSWREKRQKGDEGTKSLISKSTHISRPLGRVAYVETALPRVRIQNASISVSAGLSMRRGVSSRSCGARTAPGSRPGSRTRWPGSRRSRGWRRMSSRRPAGLLDHHPDSRAIPLKVLFVVHTPDGAVSVYRHRLVRAQGEVA